VEQNKPESEDEIHEHIDSVQSDDTDDEWSNIPVRYCMHYNLSFLFSWLCIKS